jgi:hypothetical protein
MAAGSAGEKPVVSCQLVLASKLMASMHQYFLGWQAR